MTTFCISLTQGIFAREFLNDNINFALKIKHFILQQIVDKSTALSDEQLLCMHRCFKKVITKIFRCL